MNFSKPSSTYVIPELREQEKVPTASSRTTWEQPTGSQTSSTASCIPGINNQTLTQPSGPAFHTGIATEGKPDAKEKVQPMACDVCGITVTSRQVMNSHLVGKKHKQKYQKYLRSGQLQTVVQSNKTNHINGWVNSTKVTDGGVQSENSENSTQGTSSGSFVHEVERPPLPPTDFSLGELYCGICDVTACSAQTILDHANGKKHKKKELQYRIGGIGKKVDNFKDFYCDVCDSRMVGTHAMTAHVQGRKHVSKCLKILVGKDYLVAKGKWAVPADSWQEFDYKEMERKRKPKDDGGWGMVSEGPKTGAGRGAAFIGTPTPGLAQGLLTPGGYVDFTSDTIW